jgi:2-iminobutanoate/2-iminopropanoate deaminase
VPKGKLVESDNVKAAEGRPYSPAMRLGDYLYISGQVPLDSSGKTVGPGDPVAQTRQCFENIKELVEAAGGTMDDVFWLTSYVTDIRVFVEHPHIRTEYFSPPYPASTVVQISSLAQTGWMIEIEARAYLGS